MALSRPAMTAPWVRSPTMPGQPSSFPGGPAPSKEPAPTTTPTPPATPPGPGPSAYEIASPYKSAPVDLRNFAGADAQAIAAGNKARARQESMLGPDVSSWLLSPSGEPLRRADLPLVEFRLGAETQKAALANAQRAYDEMRRAYGEVGQSPESLAAKEAAMEMLQSGGPYTDQLLQQLRGGIQNQSAYGLEAAKRAMEEDFARRGLGGGMTSYELAQLAERARASMQDALTGLSERGATTNWAAKQGATSQVAGLAGAEEAQKQAINRAIFEHLQNLNYETPDLSSLLLKFSGEGGYRPVGY